MFGWLGGFPRHDGGIIFAGTDTNFAYTRAFSELSFERSDSSITARSQLDRSNICRVSTEISRSDILLDFVEILALRIKKNILRWD